MERIRGIVVDIVKHNDSNNIVTLFTRSRGRVTFFSPVGKGRNARVRNARLTLLTEIETDVNFRAGRELQRLGDISAVTTWPSLYFNPLKLTQVQFIADFLNRYFRDSSSDENAYRFVTDALSFLERSLTDTANFHIAFLMQFLTYAGIRPDMSAFTAGNYFDMTAGVPVRERPLNKAWLSAADTLFLNELLRINFRNSRLFRFNRGERGVVVRKILMYYSLYYPGIDNLRSLSVLEEIFS